MRRELHGKEKLATARRMAKLKLPYLTSLMNKLAPVAVPGLGTFGVTESLVLIYDPEVLEAWPLKKVAFVFSHEVFHPLHKHAKRARRMKVRPDEREAWNNCADACINETLRKVWHWCPDDAYLPHTIGQPGNLTVEERFAMMRRDGASASGGSKGDQGEQGSTSTGPPNSDSDASGEQGDPTVGGQGGKSAVSAPGRGKAEDSAGAAGASRSWGGRCGSGAGNPLPGEPKPDHPASRSPAQVVRAIREAAEAIRDAESKMAGSVPGNLLRAASEVLKPPEVKWQQKLQRAARRAVAWKAGAVDYRYDGVSRKQGGVGFGTGKPILPRLRAPEVKVELWVDTSGSMSGSDLGRALSEGVSVLRAAGTRVRFMAIDSRIHEEREVRSVREMRALLTGGGGTSFVPAFESLKKRRRHDKPAVVIFATDGFGRAPAEPPPGVHVIWLLIGRSKRPCTWGEHIEVK